MGRQQYRLLLIAVWGTGAVLADTGREFWSLAPPALVVGAAWLIEEVRLSLRLARTRAALRAELDEHDGRPS